jgi:flagellar secretion chaperone FliS
LYTSNALRERFVDGAVSTASGPKVVVMAFDRLDRDIGGAMDAIEQHDITTAHALLCHAQDIVNELLCMLDPDAWEHAASLASIYRYVLTLLTHANVNKELGGAREARMLLAELGEAFRHAANAAATSPGAVSSLREFSVQA